MLSMERYWNDPRASILSVNVLHFGRSKDPALLRFGVPGNGSRAASNERSGSSKVDRPRADLMNSIRQPSG